MLSCENEPQTIATNKSYPCIDLIKFICALLVVTIHISPLRGNLPIAAKYFNFTTQFCLARIAVPFFFVASGFFLFRKMPLDNINSDTIKEYCFKLLRLFGLWTILIFIGEPIQLWYLSATVISVVLVSIFLYYRVKLPYIGVIALLLYGIGILGDTYYGILEPLERISLFRNILKGYFAIFSSTRNGLFMGFIFVYMGALFAHQKSKIKPWVAFVGLLVSIIFLFTESFWLYRQKIPRDYNMYISLLPTTYFLFAFAKTVQLKDRPIYKRMRTAGVLIYFSHMLVNRFVRYGLKLISGFGFIDAMHYEFWVTLLCTVFLAFLVERLSCTKKFHWLQWFIS